MKTDWKFWYVKRGDGTLIDQPDGSVIDLGDGPIEEVTVRVFEGTETPEAHYRRIRRLGTSDLAWLGRAMVLDGAGLPTLKYTTKDFGETTDEEDVRAVVNADLARDQVRQPIDAQRLTLDHFQRIARLRQ